MTRLCNAPFNAMLVDPNKGVRPCCDFRGPYYGNLKTDNIQDIFNSPTLKQLREDMENNVWNEGCLHCKQSEEETGKSPRLTSPFNSSPVYEGNKIVHLEYNSSNTCNLVCVMCGPAFSSVWNDYNNKYKIFKLFDFDDPYTQSKPPSAILPSDIEFADKFINETDFSYLKSIMFKGGEPFLNKENLILLEHLDKIGKLKDIEITVNTNATFINEHMMSLIEKCRQVGFIISIDGTEKLNRWIRWGYNNPSISESENLLKTIKRFIKAPNLKWLSNTFCVQAYNIFNLVEFNNWWKTNVMVLNRCISPIKFNHIVMGDLVSVRVLSDETRLRLADYYSTLDPKAYENVVNYLRLPYFGNLTHNKFVEYTKKINATRDIEILDIVPELETELKKM
jgi:radical SAM protein with 4Fe4S-binding SPASM domain